MSCLSVGPGPFGSTPKVPDSDLLRTTLEALTTVIPTTRNC